MNNQSRPIIVCYNYDRYDNFFINEEIVDIDPFTGTPLLPMFATFVEPQSKITDGIEISVFDPLTNEWHMHPNNFWRPQYKRRIIQFKHELTGDLSIKQIPLLSKIKYKGIPHVIAPSTISMSLSGRLHYLNNRTKEIKQIHTDKNNGYSIERLHYFKIISEDFIIQIKRFIDDVFMHEWIELERDTIEFKSNKIVKLRSINGVESLPPSKTKEYLRSIKEKDLDFFKTIIDLRNSFAHHLAVPESYVLIGLDHPTINTIYMKDGNLNTIELIEVYVEDLTKSFNNFIEHIFNEA